MRVSLITKFAVRTLRRKVRRTLLSVIGVGVGCAIAMFMVSFSRGGNEIRFRSIADSGFGHMRIAPAGWEENRENELRLQNMSADLEAVRSSKAVKVAAPHARTTALLAFGTRVTGAEMLGVDPPAEQRISRIARAVSEGRYLEEGDRGATVIGSTIAQRLDVELDDDLFITVAAKDGNVEYGMLRIVGIIDTGSREMDASICHVTLEDMESLTGLEGAGEISITLNDYRHIARMVPKFRESIPEGDAVITWREILPEQAGDLAGDRAFRNIIIGIVILVVILGITSARLTAVLERKREFAVLVALGMKSVQIVRLIFLEALVVGAIGAVTGLLLITPVVYHTATRGIDFSGVLGGDTALSGVLFEPTMYSDMGFWMIPFAFAVALASTVVASIYPVWFALKVNPTSALSLREA
ncbi:MAG: ABC transporter permease [Candidatus Eiseniibacteriota bacterium]|nr:MAG: ABC transporter permease [Candidatus Eisenbacteria bacterium]